MTRRLFYHFHPDEATDALHLEAALAARGASRAFEIDGELHYVPGRTACACGTHRWTGRYPMQCPRCGGYRHYQPLYGGDIWVCEGCGCAD